MDINIIKSKFEECKKHFGLLDFGNYASNVINEILAPGAHVNFKDPIFGEFYGVLINGIYRSQDGNNIECCGHFEKGYGVKEFQLHTVPHKTVLSCIEQLIAKVPEIERKRKIDFWNAPMRKSFKERFKHWKKDKGKGLVESLNLSIQDFKNCKTIPGTTDAEEIDSFIKMDFIKYWEGVVYEIVKGLKNGEDEDDIRTCDVCGLPMNEGYYLGGEFACDDVCCLASYDGDEEQMNEDLSHANEDCSDVYYTEWENVFY